MSKVLRLMRCMVVTPFPIQTRDNDLSGSFREAAHRILTFRLGHRDFPPAPPAGCTSAPDSSAMPTSPWSGNDCRCHTRLSAWHAALTAALGTIAIRSSGTEPAGRCLPTRPGRFPPPEFLNRRLHRRSLLRTTLEDRITDPPGNQAKLPTGTPFGGAAPNGLTNGSLGRVMASAAHVPQSSLFSR